MKYLIANWKMKLSYAEEIQLAQEISALSFDSEKLTVCLTPSFLSLHEVLYIVRDSPIRIAAQDAFYEEKGAYTGEISPLYLQDVGCTYVILGHSERRMHLQETDILINKKVQSAINNRLIPILCVGESSEERSDGNKDHIVSRQVERGVEGVELIGSQKLIIAYEPVWAIGTGQAAFVQEIIYMHQVIYHTLLNLFSKSIVTNNTFVIYGGSVDASNISEILKEHVIDGALIGSSSLSSSSFKNIIEAAHHL